MIFFAIIVSLAFSFVMKIGDRVYDKQDFYLKYTKHEWEGSSDVQKNNILRDYIKRESASIAAQSLGFEYDPGVVQKVNSIKKQLLVNFFYDEAVGLKVISKNDLSLSKKNLKTEISVYHLLVGFKGGALKDFNTRDSLSAKVLAAALYDTLSGDFQLFTQYINKYSDDPGKLQNNGHLGWLSWGRTPMSFQSAAWSLEQNSLSTPILTPLGYHLVWVDSTRSSSFAVYDNDSYDYFSLQSLFGVNQERLRTESAKFDNDFFSGSDFSFFKEDLNGLLALILEKKSSLKKGERFNVLEFLRSIDERFVVCSISGNYYGLRWFLYDLDLINKSIDVNNYNDLVSFFKPLILQKNAFNLALELGFDKKEYFIKRFNLEKNAVLYDKYLKYLVNSVNTPDSSDIKKYYFDNLQKKYSSKERVLVRQIKVAEESLADSLVSVLSDGGGDFFLLCRQFSLFNPSGGGLMEPFEKGKYNFLGEAAFELNPGAFSGKIKNPDKTFSIILLEEIFPSKPIPIKKVYKRIESLLIKKAQDEKKKLIFDEFYNNRSLVFGEEFSKHIN